MAPLKPKPKTVVAATAGGNGRNHTKKATATTTKRRPKLKWRTRDAQNSQLYNLQLDINDLQQEIQQLAQTKSLLLLQTRLNRMDDRDGSYVKIVGEYHHIFERGFRPVVVLPNNSVVHTMEFLSRVMDERVSIGRFVGLDMMRDQWTRYSRALSNLELRHVRSVVLPQMDYVTPTGVVRPVAMVSSHATYTSVFTLETMELMFPHLVSQTNQHRSLLSKLLGRIINGVADFDFVFDTRTHRVIGYDFRLDLLPAFAQLLVDPEELCQLFDGAKISEEFLIGDLNVYHTTDEEKSDKDKQQTTGGDPMTTNELPVDGDEEMEDTDNVVMAAAAEKPMPAIWMTMQRSLDPIVLKYATRNRRTSDKDNDNDATDSKTKAAQLHSKLTSILDPVDRVLQAAPHVTARALVQPLPLPTQMPLRLPSLVHDGSNGSSGWQLQQQPHGIAYAPAPAADVAMPVLPSSFAAPYPTTDIVASYDNSFVIPPATPLRLPSVAHITVSPPDHHSSNSSNNNNNVDEQHDADAAAEALMHKHLLHYPSAAPLYVYDEPHGMHS